MSNRAKGEKKKPESDPGGSAPISMFGAGYLHKMLSSLYERFIRWSEREYVGQKDISRALPIYDLGSGLDFMMKQIEKELKNKGRNRPVKILIKGSPGVGKSTIGNLICELAEGELGKNIAYIDQWRLKPKYWREYRFSDAYKDHPGADIILVETVYPMLPDDTENLDLFVKVKLGED